LAKLVVVAGPSEGTEYPIAKPLILGRLETNDVPIKDGKASREHAKVYPQGQDFAIVDLNSSNGTFVNGQKVTKRVLRSGDEISIGMVTLRFEAEKAAPAAPKRATLDEAFEKAKEPGEGAKPAAAPAAGKPGELVMRGHKPLQFSRVARGKPLLGIDLEQMSDTARLAVYGAALLFFALILFIVYSLISRG